MPATSILTWVTLFAAMATQVSSQQYKLPATCDNRYLGTDYIGTLISDVINMHGVNHCASMCAGFYGCTCYSYNTIGRICYLRYGCNVPAPNAIFSSGSCRNSLPSPVYKLPTTCNNRLPRVDLIGTFIARVINMHSVQQCAYICSTFHTCTCYSYDTVGRICYLRYGCNLPAPNAIFSSGECFPSPPSRLPLPTKRPTTKNPTPRPTTKNPTKKPVAAPGEAYGTFYRCCTAKPFVTGSWQDARQACKAGQDDLVKIFDDKANSDVTHLCNFAQGCWVGLRADAQGNLVWTNGKRATYNRFAGGQPNLSNGKCVAVDAQGQWKMAPCGQKLPAICEWPVNGGAAAEVGDVGSDGALPAPWLILSALAVCCVVLAVPCVVLGRTKKGELQPLISDN